MKLKDILKIEWEKIDKLADNLHTTSHPFKDKSVQIIEGRFKGKIFLIDDWFDKLAGHSYMDDNRMAVWDYIERQFVEGFPEDNDCVYGKLPNRLGKIMHISQLDTSKFLICDDCQKPLQAIEKCGKILCRHCFNKTKHELEKYLKEEK